MTNHLAFLLSDSTALCLLFYLFEHALTATEKKAPVLPCRYTDFFIEMALEKLS